MMKPTVDRTAEQRAASSRNCRLRRSELEQAGSQTILQRVGASLYRYASLPFEIASVLLLVAIIGSVMLARTLKQEASVDDVAPDVLER